MDFFLFGFQKKEILSNLIIGPLIAAGMASVFCLETKGTNAEAPLRWDHEDLKKTIKNTE